MANDKFDMENEDRMRMAQKNEDLANEERQSTVARQQKDKDKIDESMKREAQKQEQEKAAKQNAAEQAAEKQQQQKAEQKQASEDMEKIRKQKQMEKQGSKSTEQSVETTKTVQQTVPEEKEVNSTEKKQTTYSSVSTIGGEADSTDTFQNSNVEVGTNVDTGTGNEPNQVTVPKQTHWKLTGSSTVPENSSPAGNNEIGADKNPNVGVGAHADPGTGNDQNIITGPTPAQDIVAAIRSGGSSSGGGFDVQVNNGSKVQVGSISEKEPSSNAQSTGENTGYSESSPSEAQNGNSSFNKGNNKQDVENTGGDDAEENINPYGDIFGNSQNADTDVDADTDVNADSGITDADTTAGRTPGSFRNMPGDIPIVPPAALGGYFGRRLNNLRNNNIVGTNRNVNGSLGSNYSNEGVDEGEGPGGESISPSSSETPGEAMNRAKEISNKGAKAGNAIKKAIQATKWARWLLATPIGWVIGIIGLVIIVIIVLIGAGSFFLNMPNAVRDKVLSYGNQLFRDIKGIFVGQGPTEKQLKDLGTYLQNMGYDLNYYGFAQKLTKDANGNSITTIPSNYSSAYITDDKGNITAIQSKYLAAYIAAEERSYMLGNEGGSLAQFFKDWWNTGVAKWGIGMIVLDTDTLNKIVTKEVTDWSASANGDSSFANSITDSTGKTIAFTPIGFVSAIENLLSKAQINRDTQELVISKLVLQLKFWNTGYDVYRYSLKQWVEDYGSPMQLFLTLHLATRAPEFVYKIATDYDTRVFVNSEEIGDVSVELVKVAKNADNTVILDPDGTPKMIPVTDADLKGYSELAINSVKDFNKDNVKVFTPYITRVEKNWYYQEVIFQGTTPNGQNINVYQMEKFKDETVPGAVRYYAYTSALNNDPAEVAAQTQEIPASSSGGLFGGTIGNLLSKVFSNYGGIVGTITGKISGVLNDVGFGNFGDLTGGITNGFGTISNGMFQNLDSGLLSNISNSWTQGFGNLNISQITSTMNLNNMSSLFNTNNLLQGLNSLNTSKFNLNGITNIGDLSNLTNSLNMSNLNSVLSKTDIGNVINYNGMNIDTIVNDMYKNFSPSMLKSLDSQVSSMMSNMFDLANPADATTYAKALTDSLSKQIVDNTASNILNQIGNQVQQTIAGQLNSQLLPGLENEFSRQISGLSMSQLNSLASINNMDFNSVKDISNKVSRLQSALNATDNPLQNLSDVCNRITKSMTGKDLVMMNEAIKTQNINDVVNDASQNWYGLDKDTLLDFINKMNSIDPYQSGLADTLNGIKNDTENLNVQNLKSECDKLSAYIKSSGDAFNGMNGLLASDKNDLSDNLNKLYSALNQVPSCVNDLDISTLSNIKNNVSGINSQLLTGLGAQLSGLENSTINNLINQIKSMPNQIINSLQNQLTKQISQGLQESISKSLSDKLSNDLFNSLNTGNRLTQIMAPSGGNVQQGDPTEEDQATENSTVEYPTGLYVKETRKEDYMQKAEPIRIPYNAQHWIDLLVNDKYIIVGNDNIDVNRLGDPTYMPNDRQSIWQATNGHLDTIIYGMLDSVNSVDSQYLLRDFKELFSEYGWALQDAYNKQNPANQNTSTTLGASDAFSWIFKTTKHDEIINTDTGLKQTVISAEYEPYVWAANTMGVLLPISEDKVYGFDKDLDVVSPVSGIVISKTDQTKNELGQIIPSSITIEVKDSGDKNADGMRVVIMGINVGSNIVPGMKVYGENITSTSNPTVIGKTGTDEIKIMVLSKGDHTMVSNISDFIKPPQEMRFDANGNQINAQGNVIK